MFVMLRGKVCLLLLVILCLLAACGEAPAKSKEPSHSTPIATATPIPAKTLYVNTNVGLSAYNVNSGASLWTLPGSTASTVSRAAISDGVMYLVAANNLSAIDLKTGKIKQITWSTTNTAPEDLVVFNQKIFILSSGYIYTYGVKSGALVWRQPVPVVTIPAYGVGYAGHLFISNGMLYSWLYDTVAELDLNTGNVSWKVGFGNGSGEVYDSTLNIDNVAATPNVLVVRTDKAATALKATDGSKLWDMPLVGGVHVVNDTVYLYTHLSQTPGIMLSAVGLSDGQTKWSVSDTNISSDDTVAPKTFSDDTFYAAGGPSYGDLEARSLQDGHLLWNVQSGDTYKSLTVADGIIYVMVDQQGLEAFSAQDNHRLWLASGQAGQVQVVDHAPYVLFTSTDMSTTGPMLSALDPARGTVRWQVASINGTTAPIQQIFLN